MDTVPGVHFGHLLLQLVAVAFDQTSADDEFAGFSAACFDGNLLEDGVDAFLLGVADEAAGVDDDGVAVVAVAVEVYGVAQRFELTGEVLAVYRIF